MRQTIWTSVVGLGLALGMIGCAGQQAEQQKVAQQRDRLNTQLQEEKEQHAAAVKKSSELEQQLTAAQAELTAARTKLQEAEQKAQAAEQKAASISQQFQQSEAAAKKDRADAETAWKQIDAEKARSATALKKAQDDLAKARGDSTNQAGLLATLQKKVEELTRQSAALTADLAKARQSGVTGAATQPAQP